MLKKRVGYSASLLLVLAIAALPAAAGSLPPVSPSAKDKCPVCGMFVAKYPDWLAQIRFRDQQTVFFDGAKDFFKYCLKMDSYRPGKTAAAVGAVYVTDYYSMKPIDAAAAFFVVGSDVYGPMGHELIAFARESDAAAFLQDHRGRQILRFEAVSPELLRSLD